MAVYAHLLPIYANVGVMAPGALSGRPASQTLPCTKERLRAAGPYQPVRATVTPFGGNYSLCRRPAVPCACSNARRPENPSAPQGTLTRSPPPQEPSPALPNQEQQQGDSQVLASSSEAQGTSSGQPVSTSTPRDGETPARPSILFYLRQLKWSNVRPKELATSMLFVFGVILVNYGIESMLDYYLGESPFGSLGCILFGAGVLIYLRLNRIPVSKILLSGFWN